MSSFGLGKSSGMFFIGIDLSGPSNSRDTVLAAFRADTRENLLPHNFLQGADDTDIIDFIKNLGSKADIVIGLDAPLSYNIGGGDRPGDRELRKRIIAAGLHPGSVMVPTMTRMVYLTLRGISLVRLLLLINEKIRIVEVHPGGAMALRGAPITDVAGFKQGMKSRRTLLKWLEKQGLHQAAAIKNPSDHYVAACAGALAAWNWSMHKACWLHAAEPPFHPFDFAC
jgi:uncharacterized protein